MRPLRFYTPEGKPYRRREGVELEIEEWLLLHHSERAARAPGALPETLVYFLRRNDETDEEYYGALVDEIGKRITRIAGSRLRGLPPVTAEDIVTRVQLEFLQLLLSEWGSRDTDYLEVAFALAVTRRTHKLVRQYKFSPWSRLDNSVMAGADDDEDEIERLELVPDRAPGPEAVLLEGENQSLISERYEKALAAIEDERHREAAILYFVEGWPVISRNADKNDLVTHFGVSETQMKRWLRRGRMQMRKVLEVVTR